jgi:hypothetical protein
MNKIAIKKLLDGTILIDGEFHQRSARATITKGKLTQQINVRYFKPYMEKITAMVEIMPPDSSLIWRLNDNAISTKGMDSEQKNAIAMVQSV